MNDILDRLSAFFSGMPSPLLALAVLVAGWLGATALRFIISKLLYLARFDRAGERTGLSEFLRKGNARYSPSRLAGVIAYWIALLAALLAALKVVDAGTYSAFTGKLSEAFPNLVAAILVVVVGSLVASFLSNFVLTIALNASMPNARLLSKSIKYLGVAIVVMVALGQIGLGKSIIDFMFEMLFGAVCLGAALAFGLGCKDMARDSMQRFLRNLKEKGRGSQGTDLEG